MSIFLFFALIGIGYILYRQKPQYMPVVALFSLAVLMFYVPNPLFTSQTISRMFRIDRFWILIAPFMALMMAYGIILLTKWTQSRKKTSYVFISIIFSLFIVLSIQGPILEHINPESRLYFTEGELIGYEYVNENIPFGSTLYSDSQTTRFFHLDFFSLTKALDLPYFTSKIMNDMTWAPDENQYVIFRDLKFHDGHVTFAIVESQDKMVNYVSNKETQKEVNDFYNDNNLIYSNSQISIIVGN